jgi:hypothetical protein
MNVTITFELFQPAAFGVGEREAVITGGPAGATMRFVEKEIPLRDPAIVELPALTAVDRPFVPIVAAVEFDDSHVAKAVTSRVVESE